MSDPQCETCGGEGFVERPCVSCNHGTMGVVCPDCGCVDVSLDERQRRERGIARAKMLDGAPLTGDDVRYARKALGLRSVDLAAALDVSPATVTRWEHGAWTFPRLNRLALVALLLLADEVRAA